MKGLKICGVSDPKTLNYILNHNQKPTMIGFITNYEKSRRFVEYEKLKELINVDKKNVSFVSVLVNPNDEILEKIKDLNFDYYQLYDVGPERTNEIKSKYKKKIITAITVSSKEDVIKYSASGFRDFTRIAASDPTMWRDVFINNDEAVLEMLQRFTEDLSYLQRAIRWKEKDKLFELFTRTRDIRRSIIDMGQDS